MSDEILNQLKKAADFGQVASTHHRHRLGCLINGKRGSIFGANFLKTNPNVNSPFKYIHAEFDAIQKFYRKIGNLEKATMFVGRLRLDGIMGCARPCGFCMQTIRMAGIKKVYWTEIGGYGEVTIF